MKKVFKKIKKFLIKYFLPDWTEFICCCPQVKITKEEAEELYYLIDNYEAIVKEYGSIAKWKKHNKKIKKNKKKEN